MVCSNHSIVDRYADYAPVVMRLIVAAIFIVHGGQKLFGWFGGGGIDGTMGFFASQGIEPALLWVWLVAITEFFGGVAILLGVLTRVVALALVIDMAVALFVVHLSNGFLVSKGGIEFVLAIIGLCLSLVLLGSKKWSVDSLLCKKCCK